MKLHEQKTEFNNLISIVAADKHLPESAVERDYYIVMILKKLESSEYSEQCVFKGGTSLGKCYPGSIERFSEDIDLTYLGMEQSDKACSKIIKKIEMVMTVGADTEKIVAERFDRSKSMYVWFGDHEKRIKLEIGSSVRPEPYSKKMFKSYIHEFLEKNGGEDDIRQYKLSPVTLNVLNIERTFIDKVMSVKRHAICGNIGMKARHVYDVTRLFTLPEIKEFLSDKEELKRLVRLTKKTDSYYLKKRNTCERYNPVEPYNFPVWESDMTEQVKSNYEKLHETLLYTNEKQDYQEAVKTFQSINVIFEEIEE